jgi:ubiquinone/menaquinone biosynthesis C-methylase UbiE
VPAGSLRADRYPSRASRLGSTDHGGVAHGIDASEALIEFARERLPEADLRVGEMEALPYDDNTFDLVTGFNSFFSATDMLAALREAGGVAKLGAPVVIQVWAVT